MQVQGQGADSASLYGQGACVFGSEVGEASRGDQSYALALPLVKRPVRAAELGVGGEGDLLALPPLACIACCIERIWVPLRGRVACWCIFCRHLHGI
jgi:hypothetical protein